MTDWHELSKTQQEQLKLKNSLITEKDGIISYLEKEVDKRTRELIFTWILVICGCVYILVNIEKLMPCQ